MELPAVELTLCSLEVLTELHEAEGEPAAPAAQNLDGGDAQLLLLPALVGVAQHVGQALHLAAIERRQLAPHGEGALALELAEVELADTAEGPHERRMPSALVAQAKGLRRVGQGHGEAAGVGL